MTTNILPIFDIIRDDINFKVREVVPEIVAKYAEIVDRLPPVEVWVEDELIYLLDGAHRLEARLMQKLTEVRVLYFKGTREEAEARARSANLAHNAFQLTESQRRQARTDVLLRLYEYNNKWLADDYMFCSPNTVGALRLQLEKAGRIPVLTTLKRRDGAESKRTYDKRQPPDETELPEDGDEGQEEENGDVTARPDARAGEGEDTGRTAATAPQDSPGTMSPSDEGHQFQPRQTTIALAQLGEALAAEVTMYVNTEAYSLPVTLFIAEGPIAGVPETAPGHKFVLIVNRTKAEEMNLINH